jgi:hypothetical protein
MLTNVGKLGEICLKDKPKSILSKQQHKIYPELPLVLLYVNR